MGPGTDLLKRISEASNLYAFNSVHSCHGVLKTIHLIVVKSFRELFGAEDKHHLIYILGCRSTSITATTNADISPYQKKRYRWGKCVHTQQLDSNKSAGEKIPLRVEISRFPIRRTW